MLRNFMDTLFVERDRDRVLFSALSVYFFATVFIHVIAGLAIWPTVIALLSGEGALTQLASTVFNSNLILLIVLAVGSGFLAYYHPNYSFWGTFAISLCICLGVNLIVLIAQPIATLAGTSVSFLLQLFWFIISAMLSIILSIVPSFIVACVSKLIHGIFSLSLK